VNARSRVARVGGRIIALSGDDIDTDRIMPARFLKAVTFDGLETHLFADDRAEARRLGRVHPFDDPARAGAAVLVVNGNFGCGSSREHAPQAIRRRGIAAVVGESFGDIFFANATAIGLVCATAAREDVAALQALAAAQPDAEVVVDVERERLAFPGGECAIALPADARRALLSGDWDAAARLMANEADVDRLAAGLPYLSGFGE